jgi:hypothetical protein
MVWALQFSDDDRVAETVFSAGCSIKKTNLGLVEWDSSLEWNTKKLENSPSFPLVTYSPSSDTRFRCYGILKIDFTAELCLEQNGS